MQNNNSEMRKFGLTMAAVIATLFGLLLPWLFESGYPLWPWLFAGLFLLVAATAPFLLTPVHTGWMKFGHGLGWINSRIILGMIFFTVFLLVAISMKLLGKDPMSRKIDKSLSSYRVPSEVRTLDHLEKPF